MVLKQILTFMPNNPYYNIFDDDSDEKKQTFGAPFPPEELEDMHFEEEGKEPLDEILETIQSFNHQAETFSQLLSQTRAIEHKEELGLMRFFLEKEDKHNQHSLIGERKYHDVLTTKFERILLPMQDLAQIHLQTVQQFSRDIDPHYFSVEKTDQTVKSDKSIALNGIQLQRKILADAANQLDILKHALIGTERRIKNYIDCGGINNISSAEYELIVQKRKALTSGQNHQFDYSFFDVNLLDKTVGALGIFMKETTSQYLNKLLKAVEMR